MCTALVSCGFIPSAWLPPDWGGGAPLFSKFLPYVTLVPCWSDYVSQQCIPVPDGLWGKLRPFDFWCKVWSNSNYSLPYIILVRLSTFSVFEILMVFERGLLTCLFSHQRIPISYGLWHVLKEVQPSRDGLTMSAISVFHFEIVFRSGCVPFSFSSMLIFGPVQFSTWFFWTSFLCSCWSDRFSHQIIPIFGCGVGGGPL